MNYFTDEFNSFFKELAANNNKAWFDENRPRYVEYVREPFKKLVTDVIEEINTFDSFELEPKKAIVRINNDIRFSPNKPLYKLHVGAAIGPQGTKNFGTPKMYFQLSPGDSFIADGVYMPDNEQLYKIRTHIAHNLQQFRNLYNDNTFKKLYGTFGESKKNKRLPKEFVEAAEKEPLLYNKQFYYIHHNEDPERFTTSDNLKKQVVDWYKKGGAMRQFFREAIQ